MRRDLTKDSDFLETGSIMTSEAKNHPLLNAVGQDTIIAGFVRFRTNTEFDGKTN
jgi:hypothetical protein